MVGGKMSAKVQCKAITRSGARCVNDAKLAGLCGIHLPKPKSSPLKERAKSLKEVALAAGAIASLVERLVELWRSLPFGPGPMMPSEYEYLQEQVGFSWGSERSTSRPSNLSGETINWSLAREIYDRANGPVPEIKSLEADIENFFESLPPDLRQMLYEELGRGAPDDLAAT